MSEEDSPLLAKLLGDKSQGAQSMHGFGDAILPMHQWGARQQEADSSSPPKPKEQRRRPVRKLGIEAGIGGHFLVTYAIGKGGVTTELLKSVDALDGVITAKEQDDDRLLVMASGDVGEHRLRKQIKELVN